MDDLVSASSVTFGSWRYDPQTSKLLRHDAGDRWVPVSLGSRAAELLRVLVRKPGALVSKNELMDAVWADVTVEANNLTVQVAALRRVLDAGAAGPSCIQTVPGRGYRLLCRDAEFPSNPPEPAIDTAVPGISAPVRPAAMAYGQPWPRWTAIGGIACAILVLALLSYASWSGRAPVLPRLSVLVAPFDNLGPSDDARIAAALTDDLKSALSLSSPIRVVAGQAPPSTGVQASGRILGARYVITGSERRLDDILRVNAQIVSTETASVVWTDRFDVPFADMGAAQDQALTRLQQGIYQALIPIEAARSRSKRPEALDALDFAIRAFALELMPPSPSRSSEIRASFERALQLEASSTLYRARLVGAMLDAEDQAPHGRKAVFERAALLLAEAEASDPGFWPVAFNRLFWVYWQENRRCPEVVDLAERFIKRHPTLMTAVAARRWLGRCQIILGHADAAVAVMKGSLAGEPTSSESRDYRNLQTAFLLLGRYDESIEAGERALARNPDDVSSERAWLSLHLAAAYALSDRVEQARRKLADAVRLVPSLTLRRLRVSQTANPVFAAQYARVIDGVKLAGLRDHADENADFGVATDRSIHQEWSGRTPLAVPGVETIHTDALVHLLAELHPLVIDTLINFTGSSLPGAAGLRYVGSGGELTDLAQDRLRIAMRSLTNGNLEKPIVAVGWNSESFDGSNLALRLVSLGYTRVWWYRGGRETWETRGFPEAAPTLQDW